MNFSTNRIIYSFLLIFASLGISAQCVPGASGNQLGQDYTLVWSDEFSENGAVCADNWFHQTQLPAGGNWYNNEQQHYTSELANSSVENGMLKITAIKEEYNAQGYTKSYTSARLNSKYAFTYGRVDARAKLPAGNGTWPAIWMLGQDIIEPGGFWSEDYGTAAWPAIGEIDIMEHWGNNPNVIHGSLHTTSSSGATQNTGTTTIPNVSTEFHVYSMIWDENKIQFLVDDVTYYTYQPTNKTAATWPFDSPQYFLLNIAMGGIGGTIDPNFSSSAMEIDYIRVYQKDENASAATEPTASANTPAKAPEDVISIYSDSYTDLTGTNMGPAWNQSPPVVVTNQSFLGNETKKYTPLSYQGIELGSSIDVSGMDKLHLDIWSADISSLDISLISTGPVEKASTQTLDKSQWTAIDINLADYSDVVNLQDVIQFRLEDTNGGGTLWLDNIYFYKEEVILNEPSTAAPTPIVRGASDVISIFSDAYTDVVGIDFNPNWQQTTQVTTENIAGNATLKYTNFNYQSIDYKGNKDMSNMTHLHVDVWTTESAIGISPISASAPAEFLVKKDATPRTWMSYDILLSDYTSQGITMNDLKELKFDQGTGGLVFIDNIYFYKGDVPSPPKVLSEYCEKVVQHLVNADPSSEIKLTIENTGANSITYKIESATANAVNSFIVTNTNETSKNESNAAGVYTYVYTYDTPPATITGQLQWSKENSGANWLLVLPNIPFNAVCNFPAGDVTTLSDIKVDNTTLSGFSSAIVTYEVIRTDLTIPVVTATLTESIASMVITQATSIPGKATIAVTSQSTTRSKTYTINFVLSEPLSAAPTPIARNASDVISIFSDAYTDLAGVELNPNWGQTTVVTNETVAGNAVMKYTNFNYQGIVYNSIQDVSTMTHLHVDVWTTGPDIDIRPISNTFPFEVANNISATTRTWMSYDILLSELSGKGLTLNDLKELKFDGGSSETVYIDNIYYYKGETTTEPDSPTGDYCDFLTFDLNKIPDSEVKLTIRNTGALELTISVESNDGNAVNFLQVEMAGEASQASSNSDGKYTKVLTFASPAPTTLANLRLLWSKNNTNGNRQLDLTNVPFNASCTYTAKTVAASETSTANMTVGNLTIATGQTLTIAAGHTLFVNGDMTLNGNLVINSGASLITYDGKTTGGVTVKRNTRYADGKYSFVGSPVNADASITGADLGPIVYKYNETTAYGTDGLARWEDATSTQLTAGKGYAQANKQEITFTGVPNDGTITVSGLSHTALDDKHGEHGWSLLSNPYPAAIDVTKFLTDATNSAVLNGSIYLWDDNDSEAGRGDNGDYLTANSLGAVGGPNGGVFNGYIGSMQGFFVKVASPTTNGNVSVQFTESMRVGGVNTDGTFFRKDNAQSLNVRLALQTESGLYNELLVGLRENATIGVDRSFDADKLIADQDLQFYSMIESNKYAIQGLPLVDGVSTELAFNLGEASALTLSVKELVASAEQHFYLYDKVTGVTYDLNETESISFSASKGSDQNRFVLTYSVSDVLANETLTKDPIYRFANNELTVSFNGSTLVSGYAIYDLSGKAVSTSSLNSSVRELTIPINRKGINIIRIVTAEGTFTRKFLF